MSIKTLDDAVFEEYTKAGSFSAFAYFDGEKTTREEQKNRFLSGEDILPKWDYPTITQEEIKERK